MTTRARAAPVALAACALLGCLALAGCGNDPYEGQPTDGTLHVALVSEMKGFDPTQADEETSNLCVYNVFDQLYEYHYLKRPFELVPALAASLPEISADGLTYTIRLKPGIRYQDDACFVSRGGKGREFVAADVVFCLQRLMDYHVNSPGTWLLEGRIVGLDAFREATKAAAPDLARSSYPPSEGFPAIAGLSAPDERTVVIRLTEPYAELVWVFAMAYTSVYPSEAIAHYGHEFRDHPVGTGPYLLESYRSAQRAVLVRNPTFRDDRFPAEGSPGDEALGRLRLAGRALPLNERVILTVMRESLPRWLYFELGQLDYVAIPIDNFFSAIDPRTLEVHEGLRARGVRVEKDPRLEIAHDLFNMDDPVIGRAAGERGRALRRAMNLAFDRDWTSKNIYNGQTRPVEGPILEEFPEFDPAFRNPWKRAEGETMEQARERARRVLAEAGMPGGKGVPPLSADLPDSTTDEQIFLAFQSDLEQIGLEIRPYRVTWQEQIRRQRESKYQIGGLVWGADYPAAQNFLQLFYGPNRSPGSNSSNYQNDEFDRLYAEARTMPEGAPRNAHYQRMQRIVVDDAPWLFRYRRESWNVINPWLEGFRFNDISLKYFKYRRVNDEQRATSLARWNRPVLTPVFLALGAVALVVGLTLRVARRQVKGW